MDDKTTKKSSPLTLIILFLIAIAIIFAVLNWRSVYRKFAPPKPVIVSKGADDLSSKLFDYSVQVWADVRNDGGDGFVVMKATFYQNRKSYTKTTRKYFNSLETARMKIIFDEAGFFDGNSQFSINVLSNGK
jgi:hypothetical protein